MHNFTKAMLAALMLVGFGFTNTAFAWVDCDGVSTHWSSKSLQTAKSRCENFQFLYGNTDRDWIDPVTGVIRYANQKWNGTNEYVKGKGPAGFVTKQVQPKKVVVKKSKGQKISESSGFYAVIEKYGMKDGLEKIRLFWATGGWPPINLVKVEKHLASLSWNEIQQKASMFAMADDLKKFLE